MWPTITAAFLTGLVGGLHCIGMCGGFAAAAAGRDGARGTALYTAGRLTTYAVLGAIAGSVGLALGGLRVVGLALSLALLVWFAGRLAGLFDHVHLRMPWVERAVAWSLRRRGYAGPYLLGAANALIPCGLVYAALALPVAGGSPWVGAAAMVAFGIGTAPALSALGLGSLRLQRAGVATRRALAVAVLVAGSWALLHRAPAAMAGPDAPQEESLPECCQGHVDPSAEP